MGGQREKRFFILYLSLAVGLLMLAYKIADTGFEKIDFADIEQTRLDVAFPPIQGADSVGQTFVARHPNLSAVELTLVVYQDPSKAADQSETLTFHLNADSSSGKEIITAVTKTVQLEHNQSWRISFRPQADSEGQLYYLWLAGSPINQSSVWYSSIDSYGDGRLYKNHRPIQGDLRFSTYYTYNPSLFWRELGEILRIRGPLTVLFLVGLGVTGWALAVSLFSKHPLDTLGRLALGLGLGLAVVPVIFLWVTVAGGRLSPMLVAGGLLLAGGWSIKSVFTAPQRTTPRRLGTSDPVLWTGLGLFALILLLRLTQIRDLLVPPGIDSPHHALITQLVSDTGRVPATFRPLLPIDEARYHFGFHAVAAGLHWLFGRSIPQTILVLGQVLNAGVSLSVYLLARQLTRRSSVGLASMAVSGLISPFPSYYLTWGRYTAVAGLALLPIVLNLTLACLESRERHWPFIFATALTWSGLLLTHYQMWTLALCFLFAYLLYTSVLCVRTGNRVRELWLRAGLVSLPAILLVSPWLYHLARSLGVTGLTTLVRIKSGYNVPYFGLLEQGGFPWLLLLAGLGTLWGLWRRQRWVLLVWLWMLVAFGLANLRALGMLGAFVLNNAAVVLVVFVPTSILAGYLVVSVYHRATAWLEFAPPVTTSLWRAAVTITATVLLLRGAWSLIPVVNPTTVFVTSDDLEATDWIQKNTDEDALFLVNAWVHAPDKVCTGPDAGVWIPFLTGRRSTLPPITYGQGSLAYQAEVRTLVETLLAANSVDEEAISSLLDRQGVTHVYLGAKPGHITPKALHASPNYEPVYTNGAVSIFAVLPDEEIGGQTFGHHP